MRLVTFSIVVLAAAALSGCTMRHTIEPSDKPIVVNLNVKIDHEIKVKIRDENQDLLNLEDEVLKKKGTKKGTKG
jgi:hypothetical protein